MTIKLARLFARGVARSLAIALSQRADLIFETLLAVFTTASGWAAITLVFTHTASLGGWGADDAILLLGTYTLISAMLHAFVEPNLGGLGGCIYSGALDDALLQPAPALFTVSLSRCDPWALLSALSGVVVIGAQLSRTGFDLATLPAFIALLSCSLVLMWATRTALALLPFWSPGADLDVLFWALWQSGKFPVSVYHPAVQRLLTVAIPVGLISALPARALSGVTDLATVLGALGACVVAVVVVLTLWRLALRRYTSATS